MKRTDTSLDSRELGYIFDQTCVEFKRLSCSYLVQYFTKIKQSNNMDYLRVWTLLLTEAYPTFSYHEQIQLHALSEDIAQCFLSGLSDTYFSLWYEPSSVAPELCEDWKTLCKLFPTIRKHTRKVKCLLARTKFLPITPYIDICESNVTPLVYTFLFAITEIRDNDQTYCLDINDFVPHNRKFEQRWKAEAPRHWRMRLGDKKQKLPSYREALDHFYVWSRKRGFNYQLGSTVDVKLWW